MKKYELILMVGMVCFVGCSQKDENIETVKKKSVVTQSPTVTHKVTAVQTPTVQAPIVKETISQSYIESIQNELKKSEEEVSVSSTFVTQEMEPSAPIPEHIKNSTIESVPR